MKQFSIITPDNTNTNFHCSSYERYRYKPNFTGYWHSHAYTEIFFITDGKGYFFAKDEKIPIHRGMVIINNGNSSIWNLPICPKSSNMLYSV